MLCLLLLGAALPQTASALGLGEIESCSLDLSYMDGDTPLKDVEFRLYRAGEFTGKGIHVELLEPYKGYGVTPSEDWLARARTMAGYVARDRLTPVVSGKTGEDGAVSFSGLEKGLYLVVGDTVSQGGYIYTPTPFFMFLPNTQDGYTWESAVTASVKYSRTPVPVPDPGRSVRVLKVWDDGVHKEERPESVTVDLLRGGAVYDTVTLSRENNWRHQWDGLSTGDDWQVAEREMDSYSVSVSQGGITFTLTNTHLEPPLPDKPVPSNPLPSDEPIPSDPFLSDEPTLSEPPVNDPPDEDDIPDWNPPLGELPDDPNDPAGPTDPEPSDSPDSETSNSPDPETSNSPAPAPGTPNNPGDGLPQTGQLWWPVPMLGIGGAVLVMLGVLRRRKYYGNEEETE